MTGTRRPRLALSSLRTLLAVVAFALGLVALSPDGAAAQPNTGSGPKSAGQTNCESGGGTWTVNGDTATCKGRTDGQSWSCNLKVNKNGTACSHLPGSGHAARPGGGGKGNVVIISGNLVPSTAETSSGSVAPADAAAEASGEVYSISPLDE